MKKKFNYLLILVFLALNNCNSFKKSFGFEKDVPDEFLIKKTVPIERPPNFELLPPDTKNNKKNSISKTNENRAKSIINKTLNKNEDYSEKPSIKSSSTLEKGILEQIGKQ